MTFAALIFKNLVRQRTRTFLTVLGISLGITTVVALGVVTESLKASSGEILKIGDADFMVAQEGAADLSFSIVPQEQIPAIAAQPGVEDTEGILFHIARVGSNPYFFLMGRERDALIRHPPPLTDGGIWDEDAEDQIILGHAGADNLGAKVGDRVEIEDRQFTVVGIFKSGRFFEDGGAYAPLPVVQQIAGRAGVVTAVFIHLEPGADAWQVGESIEENVPGVASIVDISDYSKVDQGIQFLDAANIAISVLAVGIGAIGVMNTMVMSVFERTREIGILRAVGWSGRRILRMIVGESLFLCAIAAMFGSALGVAATRVILLIETVRNLLEPQYSLEIFVRALIVSVTVALVGAVYPAIRAVRLTPMEALRYE